MEIDEQLNWTAKEPGTRAFLLTNLALKSDNPGWKVAAFDVAPLHLPLLVLVRRHTVI